ncbi:integrin-linked kinase-associated serine/threonine phosphatase 2C isoform X5 [Lepisosteus oculatus]|uniref:integrin-linked kinase-associated serine/threonine phosphatase 2C isoform X5 n=1 Tax=Lepisosteus oculatus TaxID=7918 RepID=UPI0035F50DA6
MDLFGDLPEPTQTTAADTGSSKDSKTEEKPKTEKRKLDTESNGTEQQLEEKKVCKGIPRLKGYVAARKGEREEMQDAHVILPDFSSRVSSLPSQISHLAYFAVFDGHGGSRASRYAAQNLHLNLALKFPKGDAENLDKLVKKCLLDTFKQTDDDFLKHASSQKPAWKDGSTATCMLVMDDVVYVANLGDSRAVLCRGAEESPGKFATLALSKEHNPTCYEERMRIQKAGGMVRFMILACDGLFKVFAPEEAVKFVMGILQDEALEKKEGKARQEAQFETACHRLASEAVRRGCADNVTVILVAIEF